MLTILAFIVALGILVLVHEWGHFIVARKSGIRVEEFSIGFGPKLIAFKKGDTEYKISLLPLGGYVKLYGEDPQAEAQGDSAKAAAIAKAPDAFANKPLPKRLATVLGGPSMNLVLCFLIMPIVFMVGRKVPAVLEEAPVVIGIEPGSPAEMAGVETGDKILKFDGKPVATWSEVLNQILIRPNTKVNLEIERQGQVSELPLTLDKSPHVSSDAGYAGFEPLYFWGNDPIVSEVAPGSPAEKMGLKPGDQIVAVNDKVIRTWTSMTEVVRNSEGKPLNFTFQRGDETIFGTTTPEYSDQSGGYVIGILKKNPTDGWVKKQLPFGEAIREGFRENAKLFVLTADVLGRLFTFNLSYKSLGGPVQIAKASGDAASAGLGEFLYFVAFLSMQLGVLNLLPIPVLDGGHVLFMLIETVRRKPLSIKVRSALTQVGFYLLISLMILVTINDVNRMVSWGKWMETIKGIF